MLHRRISLVLLPLVLLVVSCDTSSSVDPLYKDYFVKYYGEDGEHISADIVTNPDNTYVLLGTVITPGGNRRIFLTKVDVEGNQIWQQTLGASDEYPQDIEPLPNGGYVVLSNVLVDVLNEYYQFKLIRVDANGAKIDSVQYNILEDQFARSVTPLSDGGFYVVGNSKDSDLNNTNDDLLPKAEQEDLLLVRFDNTLLLANTEEDRIGRSTEGTVIKVFENASGDFSYVASSDEPTVGESGAVASEFDLNFVFRKFEFTPNQVSTLYVGDNLKNETMEYAMKGIDDQIYAVGTAELSTGLKSILLAKVTTSTSSPTRLFSKDFGAGTSVEGVALYPSGGYCYILANKIDEASQPPTRDIWLTRVNAFDGSQDAFWATGITFGTVLNDDSGCRVLETSNGNLIILATVNITNQRKMALIKVNNIGGFE